MTVDLATPTVLAGLDSIAVMADDDDLREAGLYPDQVELVRSNMAYAWPVQLQLHMAAYFGLSN